MDADWLCFDPAPSRPRLRLPPGAVDTHCHVFGPGDMFPYAETRRYTPCDAGKDRLFALRDHIGFDRTVIVQASCHGTDNRAMIDAVRAGGDRARGVAAVDADVADEALLAMHEVGVRALRFVLVRRLAEPLPDLHYADLARRIALLGWHCLFYLEQDDLFARRDLLAAMPVPVVLDHMARIIPPPSFSDPQFIKIIELLDAMPHLYVKISGFYLMSQVGEPDYADVVAVARFLASRYPDRIVWGSDWPHPGLTSGMPDDGALVDLIDRVAPDASVRDRMLVANPARLYG